MMEPLQRCHLFEVLLASYAVWSRIPEKGGLCLLENWRPVSLSLVVIRHEQDVTSLRDALQSSGSASSAKLNGGG